MQSYCYSVSLCKTIYSSIKIIDLSTLFPLKSLLKIVILNQRYRYFESFCWNLKVLYVQVTFDKLPANADCLCHDTNPYGGRRMLKLQLYMAKTGRDGWMWDFGDSVSNNGWGRFRSMRWILTGAKLIWAELF